MSVKKRWFTKLYSDTQINTQIASISCTSSESEEELDLLYFKKKRKLQEITGANWCESDEIIKGPQYPQEFTIRNECDEIEPPATPCFNNKESPVLIGTKSPILTNENSYSYILTGNKSPILTRDKSPILTNSASRILKENSRVRFLKQKRQRYNERVKEKSKENFERSPELFSSQSTDIIRGDSPVKPVKVPEYNISPIKSLNSQPVSIDPVPSSQICSVATSSVYNPLLLYHQPPPPRRRKRYKRGSLARQVQGVITRQQSSISIWLHEMYLKKAPESIVVPNEDDIIEFGVNGEWTEYGGVFLECEYFYIGSGKSDRVFLVLLGRSFPTNIKFEVGCRYKIFPPYSVSKIEYKGQVVNCYLNISKFLPCS